MALKALFRIRNAQMRVNKNTLLGGFVWISLALIMVRDVGLIQSDLKGFFGGLLLGLFLSYQIVAYLFGWIMPTITFTAGLVKG